MNEITQLIEEQKKTLPSELVGAIESTAWEPVVQKIGQKRGLNTEQIEILEQETLLLIYGFENPTNFVPNIVKEVGVDETKANELADLIWTQALEPINIKAGGYSLEASRDIHPMIESGETAHEVAHEETANSKPQIPNPSPPKATEGQGDSQPTTETKLEKKRAQLPDYRYPGGKDPYREPLV